MPTLDITFGLTESRLPSWTFQGVGGDCQPGFFVTDAANSNDTTTITINAINRAGSDSGYITGVSSNATFIIFRDQVGRTAHYTLKSTKKVEGSGDPGCYQLTLMSPGGNLDWNGVYSFQYANKQ